MEGRRPGVGEALTHSLAIERQHTLGALVRQRTDFGATVATTLDLPMVCRKNHVVSLFQAGPHDLTKRRLSCPNMNRFLNRIEARIDAVPALIPTYIHQTDTSPGFRETVLYSQCFLHRIVIAISRVSRRPELSFQTR